MSTMGSLQLVNAQLVNEGRIVAADVLIRGERIERIGTGAVPAGTTTIDLKGKHLLPGLIDDQVHCREPGLTHKATLATESLAALCGGVTSFLDMPNTQPPSTDRAALAEKRRIAAATCHVNYGFYLGATNTNLEEIKRVGVGGRVRHQGLHGRLDGQHARRRSSRARRHLRRGAPADRDALRVLAADLGEREALSRALRRERADRGASVDPLGGGVLSIVVAGRRPRQETRRASARPASDDGARARRCSSAARSRASASRPRSARIICGSTSRATRRSARRSSATPRSRRRPTATRCERPSSTIASTSSRRIMRRTRSRRRRAATSRRPRACRSCSTRC